MRYNLDDIVYHEDVCGGKKKLKIVGVRKHEVELEYGSNVHTDIHNLSNKDWFSINGVIPVVKDWCSYYNGSCNLPNVHCSAPKCLIENPKNNR